MILPISYIRMLELDRQIAGEIVAKSVVGEYSPFVLIMALLIFYGFCNLDIQIDLSDMSAKTMYIYLIHAGVLELLVLSGIFLFTRVLDILFGVVIIFLVSYIGAKLLSIPSPI